MPKRPQHPDAAPADANAEKPTYSSDQPIRSKGQDRFNRWPFAARIAQTLALRRDPASLVLGIYGAWGEGKSSVLFLLEQELARDDSVVCVRFNPWHFGAEEQMLRGFFATLASSVGRTLSTKVEKVGRTLEKYGSVLSLGLNAGSAAQGLGKALSTVELDELRGRLEAMLAAAGKRVVVMVDDIDRLDRNEIHAVFKLVKLSANFEHTSYVLAFDDDMVAAALGDRYGGGGPEAGRSFLEKIVQVPLRLPPADEVSLRMMVVDGMNAALAATSISLGEADVQALLRHYVDGLEPRVTTPRLATLYANALAFVLPLLEGEVHPVDLILMEGVRVFYPRLYADIRDNRDCFVIREGRGNVDVLKKRVTEIVERGLRELPAHERERIRRRLLEVLFPRLKGLFSNTFYGDDIEGEWSRDRRVCSDDYFDRYFRYGIAPTDVSDGAVSRLIVSASECTDEMLDSMLKDLLEGGRARKLIPKLRRLEDDIGVEVGVRLVGALVRLGFMLPRKRQMGMPPDWTMLQAAILITVFLKKIVDVAERERLGRWVVEHAVPIKFGFEFLRFMRKDEKEADSERLFAADTERSLEQAFASRVGAAAAEAPLYRTDGRDAPTLYWAWRTFGGEDAVPEHIAARLQADESAVDDFLASFVGLAWGVESGLSHAAPFERHAYDSVAALVEPGVVLGALRVRHGGLLDEPQEYPPRDTPPNQAIALQFAFVHRKAQAAPASAAEAPTDDAAVASALLESDAS